jgi:hypothetical protein
MERRRYLAWADEQAWKDESHRVPRYRVAFARTLVPLAKRVAPDIDAPKLPDAMTAST